MQFVKEMMEVYIERALRELWDSIAKKKGKFPLAVEEAALNSLVTGCIYRYLHDRKVYDSFAISEAKVLRDYTSSGRCDIVWYYGDNIVYFELKGPVYDYQNNSAAVKQQFSNLKMAREQVESIKYHENEKWYGYKENGLYKRYGCIMGMILSRSKTDSSDFVELEESIKEMNNISDDKYEYIAYKAAEDTCCDLSYGNIENLTGDGYFLLYKIIEL